MILQDFIKKWSGKGIDFDGVYGRQCMDLLHQYLVEVCSLTDGSILAAPAAKDVYLNYPNINGSVYFDRIENTLTGVPESGDVILWGTKIGKYGHVAIFISGTANKFKSFDQNFPLNSACHVQDHDYAGVLGWLRFKGQSQDSFLGKSKDYWLTVEKDREFLLKTEGELKTQVHDIGVQLDAANAQLKHNDEFLQELATLLNCPKSEGEIVKAVNEDFSHAESIEKLTKEVTDLKTRATEDLKKVADLQEILNTTDTSLKTTEDALRGLTRVNTELQSKYDELIKVVEKPDLEYKLFGNIIRVYRR